SVGARERAVARRSAPVSASLPELSRGTTCSAPMLTAGGGGGGAEHISASQKRAIAPPCPTPRPHTASERPPPRRRHRRQNRNRLPVTCRPSPALLDHMMRYGG